MAKYLNYIILIIFLLAFTDFSDTLPLTITYRHLLYSKLCKHQLKFTQFNCQIGHSIRRTTQKPILRKTGVYRARKTSTKCPPLTLSHLNVNAEQEEQKPNIINSDLAEQVNAPIIATMPGRWTTEGVFDLVRDALVYLSKVTGRTYVEINIIVYFIVIPCSWLAMLDLLVGTRCVITILFLMAWLTFLSVRGNFRSFSESLFSKSVEFLLFFDRFGSNYVVSSVFICVVLPMLIYGALAAALWRI